MRATKTAGVKPQLPNRRVVVDGTFLTTLSLFQICLVTSLTDCECWVNGLMNYKNFIRRIDMIMSIESTC
jgi:hypothetical protein